MQKYSNWIAASLWAVIFVLTGTPFCQAENLTSPTTITGAVSPTLELFQDTSQGQRARKYALRVYDDGTTAGFDISDTTDPSAPLTPFRIQANAPHSSLAINSAGQILSGDFFAPDTNSKVHIQSRYLNGLLLKRTDANGHYLRVENTAGVFRSGVQGNGDSQFGSLTAGKGLNLLAGGASKMTVNSSGQVSIGNPPPAVGTNALATSTGAVLTEGGVWTNNSSRAAKRDIEPITSEQARNTMRALQPVSYRYKNEPDEQYVGFIAEDVPELVATRNRKGLAAMDITAVLIKTVQDRDRERSEDRQLIADQQKLIGELSERLLKLEQKLGDR